MQPRFQGLLSCGARFLREMRDPGNEVVIDGDPSQNTFSARFTCPLIPLTVRIVAPSNFATSKAELNMPWTKESP